MHPKDEHLLGLGKLTANFQVLELTVAFLVWSLIGQDQRVGQIVTSHLPFGRLLDVCSSLLRHRVGNEHPYVAELEALLTRAEQAEARRNSLIHSAWAIGEEEGSVARLKFTSRRKQGLRVQEDAAPVDELRAVVGLFPPLISELTALLGKLEREGLVTVPKEPGMQPELE